MRVKEFNIAKIDPLDRLSGFRASDRTGLINL